MFSEGIVFAEAVWCTCEDGLYMPLEIAFASCSTQVHVFRVAPLPAHYWLTLNDWRNSRSRMYNKDRFYNSESEKLYVKPTLCERKLNPSKWLSQLQEIVSPNTVLYVRGPSQYKFFKYICGYLNVKRIKLMTRGKIISAHHNHNRSRLIRYPCPGTEVLTMAYYQAYMQVKQDN